MDFSETVIIGLGNELLGDDGFGIAVIQKLKDLGIPSLNLVQTAEHGLRLLDYLVGYSRAIIVDSFIGPEKGKIIEKELTGLENRVAPSLHGLSLGEALSIGEKTGLPLPVSIKLYAVTVLDQFVIGSPMSPEIQDAIPVIVKKILKDLGFENEPSSKMAGPIG